jgi:hypothetical protein
MTTTNNPSPSRLTPPPALPVPSVFTPPPTNTHAEALVTVWWRRGDGASFTITPQMLSAAEATRAINAFPFEWSRDPTTWAAWPTNLNTSAQRPGGRGRLLGASVAAD